MKVNNLIDVSVTYGLGGVATALLPRNLLERSTHRSAIEYVIKEKQEPGSAAERVAILVGELLQNGHAFDVEEMSGGTDGPGTPVGLDDIALRPQPDEERASDNQRIEQQDALHYILTEPYKGGGK